AAMLIVLGSMGFSVMFELMRERFRWRALSLHARVSLVMSGALLVLGTAAFALAEWRNPLTLGAEGLDVGDKLVNALFQSATMRTAGFNSIDLASMGEGTKLISVILMFIGASPASTGGGVKTTTVAVVWLIMLSVVRGHRDVNVMGRRLPTELMRRALAILTIYLMLLLTTVIALTMLEAGRFSAVDMTFEATSALATVGVSAAGTPNLSLPSRILLLPVMYLGRVGPLTLALALARRQQDKQNSIRYPEENLMIG
ncbi:MAG: TrkH family potassium uptake protein, partial [Clostridia bacterium]|nr:TrkH family potassium uptake protein [Clostridia bacterium]